MKKNVKVIKPDNFKEFQEALQKVRREGIPYFFDYVRKSEPKNYLIISREKFNRYYFDYLESDSIIEVEVYADLIYVERELNKRGYSLGYFPFLPSYFLADIVDKRIEGPFSPYHGPVISNFVGCKAVMINGDPLVTLTVPRVAIGPDAWRGLIGTNSTVGTILSVQISVMKLNSKVYSFIEGNLISLLMNIKKLFINEVIPTRLAIIPYQDKWKCLFAFDFNRFYREYAMEFMKELFNRKFEIEQYEPKVKKLFGISSRYGYFNAFMKKIKILRAEGEEFVLGGFTDRGFHLFVPEKYIKQEKISKLQMLIWEGLKITIDYDNKCQIGVMPSSGVFKWNYQKRNLKKK